MSGVINSRLSSFMEQYALPGPCQDMLKYRAGRSATVSRVPLALCTFMSEMYSSDEMQR